MGVGQITSIGSNMMKRPSGIDVVKRQEEAAEVMFADMISMNSFSDAVDTGERFVADEINKMDVCGEKTMDAYEKYQYQDKTIRAESSTGTREGLEKKLKEVKDFEEKVAEMIEEELRVSKEELEGAMEELGLTYLDLLDKGNLANLVAKLTNSEGINQLLCSEAFMNVMQQMNELGNEIQLTSEELLELQQFAEDVQGLEKVEVVSAESAEEQELSDMPSNRTPLSQGNENVVMGAAQPVSFGEYLSGLETVQELPPYVTVSDIMEQFAEQVKVHITADTTKMQMQLNPEHLGKLYVEIIENEGAITAKIETQNMAVKEALEMQMADLKMNLSQAGVKVDSVEVTIASHEFERNLEQDANSKKQQEDPEAKTTRHRNINLNGLDELSGLMTEEETLVAKMMAEQGNSVDFTA